MQFFSTSIGRWCCDSLPFSVYLDLFVSAFTAGILPSSNKPHDNACRPNAYKALHIYFPIMSGSHQPAFFSVSHTDACLSIILYSYM